MSVCVSVGDHLTLSSSCLKKGNHFGYFFFLRRAWLRPCVNLCRFDYRCRTWPPSRFLATILDRNVTRHRHRILFLIYATNLVGDDCTAATEVRWNEVDIWFCKVSCPIKSCNCPFSFFSVDCHTWCWWLFGWLMSGFIFRGIQMMKFTLQAFVGPTFRSFCEFWQQHLLSTVVLGKKSVCAFVQQTSLDLAVCVCVCAWSISLKQCN